MRQSNGIILVGAGLVGAEAINFFGIRNVYCFADNFKAGLLHYGMFIISIDELKKIHRDYTVVLSISRSDDSLGKQLDDLEIPYTHYYEHQADYQKGPFNNVRTFDKLSFGEKIDEWQQISSGLAGIPEGEAYGSEWLQLKQEFIRKRGIIGLSHEDKLRFQLMQNKYRGKRIFIIGNGPSLNRTALEKLQYEYTFATNRFYLLYDKINWRPTFYTCVDRRVVTDIYAEINGLTGSIFFFDEFFRGLFREGDDVLYFSQRLRRGRGLEGSFSFNAASVVFNGNTVLTYAIQIAYYLGFEQIFLIGCDLGYKVPETVKQSGDDVFNMDVGFDLKSSRDDDPNHFDPRYFGKGRLWHAPNEKGMIEDHELCLNSLRSKGCSIFNATVGGELEVYKRRDFDSLFYKLNKKYERNDCIEIITGDK